jgi:integrase
LLSSSPNGEQIADVLAKLSGHTLYPIVALALATGMRRGELLGVQWGDIDLDAATLRVERSLEETNAGLRLKSPKTKSGRRNITLPSETADMLRAYKIEQMRIRLVIGAGKLEPDTLVFTDIHGKPLKPHTVSRAWRRVVAARKLPTVDIPCAASHTRLGADKRGRGHTHH